MGIFFDHRETATEIIYTPHRVRYIAAYLLLFVLCMTTILTGSLPFFVSGLLLFSALPFVVCRIDGIPYRYAAMRTGGVTGSAFFGRPIVHTKGEEHLVILGLLALCALVALCLFFTMIVLVVRRG